MENASTTITKISGIIVIVVGWVLLIYLYGTYAYAPNKPFTFNMWFIYFIFLAWTIVSLVVIYKMLTYSGKFPGGSDTASLSYLYKREGSSLSKKFGLFLLGTAIVTIIAGTFLSLAITGVNLSFRAFRVSEYVQYASVAIFIVLAHAGIIIYSINNNNYKKSTHSETTNSPEV